MRLQMSFICLSEICLGQGCGLNYERFTSCRTLLCRRDADNEAHDTDKENPLVGHILDYSLAPLDAAAARTIS